MQFSKPYCLNLLIAALIIITLDAYGFSLPPTILVHSFLLNQKQTIKINSPYSTAQKWSFPFKIFSINATACRFGHIYWRYPYGKLDLRLFNISVCALLSLRPYGSRDFEIGSCCKHGFLIFVTVSVAVDWFEF